jgi:hypothetical protein
MKLRKSLFWFFIALTAVIWGATPVLGSGPPPPPDPPPDEGISLTMKVSIAVGAFVLAALIVLVMHAYRLKRSQTDAN